MQNSDSTIYFNFSYFALKLLGKGLYSNHWTAIAELVANGLDAQAKNIKIYINMKDKKNSVIEILDSGHGMGYEDIAEKYVLIGRDKREDGQIDEEIKKQLMGRKGIGKLAALYLSSKYFIISKTEYETSAWCLDASNVKDSDLPHLDRIDVNQMEIETKKEWEKFETGTMIKLTNVDLTYFGEKTLAGLKARLADFYLTDTLPGEIEAAILTEKNSPLRFEKVEKSIAFKNIYAIYNNTEINFSNRLAESVIVKSSVESVMNTPRYVEKLDSSDFTVKGKKKFLKQDGSYTSQELDYEMIGWIGIHTSIQNDDAKLNDAEYLKNKAYRPNQLRLYVRNKLAVENFLDYLKNTQAFSNYIEGEISFNILDHNELGDIATSNRQGFVEKDERVQLLISILKPIINSLIRRRVHLGQKVKFEEMAFYEEEQRKEIERRKIEEEKRKEAEKSRENEEQKRFYAEQQVAGLGVELQNTNSILKTEKKRNNFLVDSLSQDQFVFAEKLHMVKINVSTIESVVRKLIMKLQRGRFNEHEAWESLKTISYQVKRIHATLEYGGLAQFNTKEEMTEGDMFEFILEYCENVLNKYTNIKIIVGIEDNVEYVTRFSTQDVAVILENVVSNSIKHQSDTLTVKMAKENGDYVINLTDDGKGMDTRVINEDELFEFGKGYTASGTGVGLYHIREIVNKKLNGTIKITKDLNQGFGLKIRM
ncbi:ATP-binding protein [Paenibacillus sp. PCH8]|uniref:ATP-binding protein n=1 Tax=Paenibacillus sp. PCH8 TaxID=2066524 RepID=UPI000CF8927B|nr:ATP-binding protein [Paenibacillus sp. PCH8]PQP82377.1 ATP-binding protein [Paenibacillus sp. PCH8]